MIRSRGQCTESRECSCDALGLSQFGSFPKRGEVSLQYDTEQDLPMGVRDTDLFSPQQYVARS